MEAKAVASNAGARSADCGLNPDAFGTVAHSSVSLQSETGTSFTALLELPANQAVQLLVSSSGAIDTLPPPPISPPVLEPEASREAMDEHCFPFPLPSLPPPIFPSDAALTGRTTELSIFPSQPNSPESSHSKPPPVKLEPVDSISKHNSSPISDSTVQKPSNKRKDMEKKGKESNKKNKTASATESLAAPKENGGEEKLPYVHVRARRGQATDTHSLAERARREKINARMKLLQELVPGCNKISGTASVLEEIINHVQSLQRQVEYLSMRLATVNPRIDFNPQNFLAAENGSPGSNFSGIITVSACPGDGIRAESQQLWNLNGFHQPDLLREGKPSNFVAPHLSALRYEPSIDSGIFRSNQLKMEL